MATPGQIVAALAPILGKAGAAGAAGNLMQESSDRSNAPGGGLAQWQGPRQAGLQAYARAHGLAPGSDAAALGYLRQDLQGPYAGLAAALRRTNDPGQAAVLFSNQYERPGTPMMGNRVKYAQAAAGALKGLSGATLAPGQALAPGQRPGVMTIRSQTGGGVDTTAAAEAVLAAQAKRGIGAGLSTANPLAEYQHNVDSGQFNIPVTSTTSRVPTSGAPVHGSLRGGTLDHLTSHAGNVDPLGPGWTIGRTDQGVDAHAAPGTPIHAINDSVVKEVVPNWYNGQPLVLMQLTAGPDAGKYWYVAEQINSHPQVGSHVAAGDTVARFAPSGTGIEIGWGSPSAAAHTLAGATTGYTEGQVTPAGSDFAKRILGR